MHTLPGGGVRFQWIGGVLKPGRFGATLRPMRLVYFGSGAFGLPTLASLAAGHQLAAIVTQPDRPAGRGGKLTPTPIGQYAAEHLPGVPLLKPEKVNLAEVVAQIRGYNAEAWVVIAFGQKLGKALLDGVFSINLHASLLPKWRGAAPINAAIIGGDTVTGNSVITLADRMDAGLVLGQSRRPVEPTATAGELHDLLASDGPALVADVLERFRTNRLEPQTQDESLVTIAPKLSKADGVLDFNQPADRLRCRINGLNPWPGVTVGLGAEQVKVIRSASEQGSGGGEVGVLVDPARGLVRCGQGTLLKLLEVQPPGKKPMAWGDFARGRTLSAGIKLVQAAPGA